MKILFFAPHSALWKHAFPEAVVAEALQKRGHELVFATCGELFNRGCIPMNAEGISHRAASETRAQVCSRCKTKASLLRRELRLTGPDLATLVDAAARAEVSAAMARVTRESFLNFEHEGVAVGRYALYQLLLRRKRISLEFDPVEWEEYLADLEVTLLALVAARALLLAECPDRLVLYNGLYSVNRAVSRLAEQRGVPSYFLHAGGNLSERLQSLMLARDNTYPFMQAMVAAWPRFRDRPCSPASLQRIGNHFLELFQGRSVFVYSTGAVTGAPGIRERFGLQPAQKLLVATLSSYDEEFAAEQVGARVPVENLLFARQADWVAALIEILRTRPEWFLLIRVHPREFPNKRDSVKSEHAALLEGLFRTLPANVAVNWPDDRISMYALAEETDVFLNSWSSVGKEMSALGLPVVMYTDAIAFYPADLNYLGTTQEEYVRQIDLALSTGWSLEHARKVFRWLAVEYEYALLDISDAYTEREGARASLLSRAFAKVRRRLDPLYRERRDCNRRATALKDGPLAEMTLARASSSVLETRTLTPQTANAEALETEHLIRQLLILRATLYGDARPASSKTLNGRLAQLAQARL